MKTFPFPLMLFLVFLGTIRSHAQTEFETGYFINNKGQKTTCLIKNEGWSTMPRFVKYKMEGSDMVYTLKAEEVEEFGIDNKRKFVYRFVEVEQSSDQVNRLRKNKEFKLEPTYTFLEVLLEGKATLYVYEDHGLVKFFYKSNKGTIKPLLYKRYLLDGLKIKNNSHYQRELFDNLKCEGMTYNDVLELAYTRSSLMKYFAKYSDCQGVEVLFEKSKAKGKFRWRIKSGVNFSNLDTKFYTGEGFDATTTFRVGMELEYILPFNRNKWSVFLEPTYNFETSDQKQVTAVINPYVTRIYNRSYVYEYVDMPVGVRHYMYLKDRHSLFLELSLVADLMVKIEPSKTPYLQSTIGLGIGYEFGNKYSIGLRYYGKKNIEPTPKSHQMILSLYHVQT
ncbi:MAG: PorT family protein [Flavobacteriaceae bacterium]|nr:PorT family protein [Flavobacteriaceae bacterium]